MKVGGARDHHATCRYKEARHMFILDSRVIRWPKKRCRVGGHYARVSNHWLTRGPRKGGVIGGKRGSRVQVGIDEKPSCGQVL